MKSVSVAQILTTAYTMVEMRRKDWSWTKVGESCKISESTYPLLRVMLGYCDKSVNNLKICLVMQDTDRTGEEQIRQVTYQQL